MRKTILALCLLFAVNAFSDAPGTPPKDEHAVANFPRLDVPA